MRSSPLSTPRDHHHSLHHEIITPLYTMRSFTLSTPLDPQPSLHHKILTPLDTTGSSTLSTPWDHQPSLHHKILTKLYTNKSSAFSSSSPPPPCFSMRLSHLSTPSPDPGTPYHFQVQPGHQTLEVDLGRSVHGMSLECSPKYIVDTTNTQTEEDSWIRH